MRVVQVCPYSLDVPGGVQGQVLSLANCLSESGNEVTVIAPARSGEAARSFLRPSVDLITVRRVVDVPSNGSIAPISPFFRSASKTVKVLSSKSCDVVHVHEPLVPGPSLTAVLGSRVPVVGTFHMAGNSALYALLGPVLGRVTKRLSRAVAVSPLAAEVAQSVCDPAPEILFNGVDTRFFGKAAQERRTVGRSGVAKILFIGRHEERKGIRLLLEAYARAVAVDGEGSKVSDLSLTIAGEGPLTPELKLRYGHLPGVNWLGTITGEDVLSQLARCDALCVPSTGGESFGVVLVEAMAAGVPVIASDIPAYKRVAGDAAHYFKSGSVSSLQTLLSGLAARPGDFGNNVDAGIEMAVGYSMQSLAARYEEIYRRLL